MKLNFKTVISPALILLAICLIVSALLGVTNELTKGKILESLKAKEQESRKIVLADAEKFEPSKDGSYFIGKKGGDTIGFVFVTESKGYGGTIKVMTGISSDDKVQGVVILNHNETPGLGANASNLAFTDKFKQNADTLSVVKGPATGDLQIEAMTGATITTSAVTNAVNMAIEIYKTIEGGV